MLVIVDLFHLTGPPGLCFFVPCFAVPLKIADSCKLLVANFRLDLAKGRHQQVTKGWVKKNGGRELGLAISALLPPYLSVCGQRHALAWL